MKKIYITPELEIIAAETSSLMSNSQPNKINVTFGEKFQDDSWQNEMVGDGILDNTNDNFSSIWDDNGEDVLNSR